MAFILGTTIDLDLPSILYAAGDMLCNLAAKIKLTLFFFQHFGTVSSICSSEKINWNGGELWKYVIDFSDSRAPFSKFSFMGSYVVMTKMILAICVHLLHNLFFWRGNSFLDTSIPFILALSRKTNSRDDFTSLKWIKCKFCPIQSVNKRKRFFSSW